MSGITADHDSPGNLTATVRRALAARLDDLAKTPDLITPDARGALMTYAQGGNKRMHMLLATALFLAEKEQRPRVDLLLVQRAAALQGTDLPEAPKPHTRAAPSFWESRAPVLAACVLLGVMAILAVQHAMFAPSRSKQAAAVLTAASVTPGVAPVPTPVSAAPVHAPGPVPGAGQTTTSARAEPKPAPSLVQSKPQAVAPPTAAAARPNSPPAAPPPFVSQSRTASLWQPAAPSPNLVLRFSADTNDSLAGARAVTATLERAGFTVTLMPQSMPSGAQAALHYFYAEDAKVAERVKRALYLGYTTPVFVYAGRSQTPPAPGTIELLLP